MPFLFLVQAILLTGLLPLSLRIFATQGWWGIMGLAPCAILVLTATALLARGNTAFLITSVLMASLITIVPPALVVYPPALVGGTLCAALGAAWACVAHSHRTPEAIDWITRRLIPDATHRMEALQVRLTAVVGDAIETSRMDAGLRQPGPLPLPQPSLDVWDGHISAGIAHHKTRGLRLTLYKPNTAAITTLLETPDTKAAVQDAMAASEAHLGWLARRLWRRRLARVHHWTHPHPTYSAHQRLALATRTMHARAAPAP